MNGDWDFPDRRFYYSKSLNSWILTHQQFRTQLLQWALAHPRPLPWKGVDNPYFIWLSEILLQQTRVKQGLPYYLKFKDAFPKVEDLAKAPEDQVMKLWEGLGYYSRARNMHAAAKFIVDKLGGRFPNTYKDILALKGVGPYTAAAIASFAFNLPHAVVDGNVYRVLARIFGISTPSDSTAGKKEFAILAEQLLDKKRAGQYNQAIMDFGAIHCTPKKPKCENCPFSTDCIAYQEQAIAHYPVKLKKLLRKDRFFNFLVLSRKNQIYIQKRKEKDIWQKLYQFPLLETSQVIEHADLLLEQKKWGDWLGKSQLKFIKKSKLFKQTLSHQSIYAYFWEFEFLEDIVLEEFGFILEERKNLSKFAFPKIIDWYLGDNSLYLNLY